MKNKLKLKYCREDIYLMDSEFLQGYDKLPCFFQISVLDKSCDQIKNYYPIINMSNSNKKFLQKAINGEFKWVTQTTKEIFTDLNKMMTTDYDYNSNIEELSNMFDYYKFENIIHMPKKILSQRLDNKTYVGWEVTTDKLISNVYNLRNIEFLDIRQDLELLLNQQINLSLSEFHKFIIPDNEYIAKYAHDAIADTILLDDIYSYFIYLLNLNDEDLFDEKLKLIKYMQKKEARPLYTVTRYKKWGTYKESDFYNIDYNELNIINLSGKTVYFPEVINDNGRLVVTNNNVHEVASNNKVYRGKIRNLKRHKNTFYIIDEERNTEEHVLRRNRGDIILTFTNPDNQKEAVGFIQDEIAIQLKKETN